MQGSLDQPPVVVQGSRTRAIWLLIASAVFVSAGLFLWTPDAAAIMRLFSIGFFSLCGLVGLGMLITPARLVIGPSGLTQTVLWRTSRFAWTDIYNFRSVSLSLTNKAVGFDYLALRPKRAALRRLNFAFAGVQGSLQPGWEIDPETLANLLNEARERWLVVDETVPQIVPAPGRSSFMAGLVGARINRKAYWLSVGALCALAVGFSYVLGSQHGLSTLMTVFFIRIFASRLHDFGRSGWWQLVLYGTQLGVIIFLTKDGQPTDGLVGVALLIQFVFTAVLGLIPGNRDANRFGPPPGAPSPIASAEAFR